MSKEYNEILDSVDESWERVEYILSDLYSLSGINDRLRQKWLEAKQPLIDMLGGTRKVIPTGITTRDDYEATNVIDSMIRRAPQELPWLAIPQLRYSEIINNRIDRSRTIEVYDPDAGEPGKGAVVTLPASQGQRVGKLLAGLSKDFTTRERFLQDYSDLQLELGNGSKGFLVASVNPLDILMMSEHGITSCHRIRGEYFTGTISYLCDPHTMIAYLYSRQEAYRYGRNETPVELPLKKWRTLVFADIAQGGFIVSRHYPYFSEELGEATRQLVGNAMADHLGVPNYRVIARPSEGDEVSHSFRPMGVTNAAYLDPGTCKVRLREVTEEFEVRKIIVSQPFPCISPGCGCDSEQGTPFCVDCGDLTTCYNCGCTLLEDEICYVEGNDTPYCADCFRDIASYCPCCGVYVWTDDTVYIDDTDESVCCSCFEAYYGTCCECNNNFHGDDLYEGADSELYCDQCFQELFAYCEECRELCFRNELSDDGYCNYCMQELFALCEGCGELINRDELSDDGYCPDCEEENNTTTEVV